MIIRLSTRGNTSIMHNITTKNTKWLHFWPITKLLATYRVVAVRDRSTPEPFPHPGFCLFAKFWTQKERSVRRGIKITSDHIIKSSYLLNQVIPLCRVLQFLTLSNEQFFQLHRHLSPSAAWLLHVMKGSIISEDLIRKKIKFKLLNANRRDNTIKYYGCDLSPLLNPLVHKKAYLSTHRNTLYPQISTYICYLFKKFALNTKMRMPNIYQQIT